MKASREIRRCALQALFQFDLVAEPDLELVRRSLEESPGTAADHARGFDLATSAWEFRSEADAAVRPLAPEWPTHRQPAIDRNLLRLAYYEIAYGETPPRVAINEAVELAREFGGDKSPAFVNAILDRIWKGRLASAGATQVAGTDPSIGEAGTEGVPGAVPDAAPKAIPERGVEGGEG